MDFKKFLPWIIAVVIIEFTAVKGINNTAVTYEQDIKEPGVMCKRLTKEETT
jgi:LemA protein